MSNNTPAATTPTSPASASPLKETSPNGGSLAKKFEGDAVTFKGKLIGMEDVTVDRDEKICLDSMFKLKAVVNARGEHKQKIQLTLNLTAVKVHDDLTKALLATHEVERISFVVMDPKDTRAFGYIYNTSDDRHQFWAIKTEKSAAMTVLALKELFETAFEQYTNVQNAKKATETIVAAPVPPPAQVVPQPVATPKTDTLFAVEPYSPSVQAAVAPQQPAITTPLPPPPFSVPAAVTPLSPPPQQEPRQAAIANLFDAPVTPVVTAQTATPVADLFSLDEPANSLKRPQAISISALADIYAPSTNAQPAASNTNPSDLFNVFANMPPPPPQPVYNPYMAFSQPQPPPTQSNAFFTAPPPAPLAQQYQQPQPSLLQPMTSTPIGGGTPQPFLPQPLLNQTMADPFGASPMAPPSVTSPFAGFDLLGGFQATSSTAPKVTKDAFLPPPPPNKSMQQLQMEKKT